MKKWIHEFKYVVDVYKTVEHAEVALLIHDAFTIIQGRVWEAV
jgi:hypothetical protein